MTTPAARLPSPRCARQALARLQQMAGLDLRGPPLVEPVMQALHRLVGFDAGGYVHPGSDGVLQTYLEDPAIQAREAAYFDPRILRSENAVLRCSLHHLGHTVHLGAGPLMLAQLLKVPYAELLRSEFYDVMLRPSGVTDWATLVLRADGRRVGTLVLYRHAGSAPFTREELDVLAPLQATLAHVLQPGDADAHDDGDDSERLGSGLLVATAGGRPQWISPEAEALLRQAFGWRWRGAAGALPAPLQALLRRLHAPALPGEPLPVPQMRLCNAQGWFSLRATRMEAARGERQAVAVHITRRAPRGVRLLSALQALGLPQRQHELAWWLARGLPESQIAARMGISANTVVYHRRQLYNRLGLQERRDLLRRLDQGSASSST
ncbi:helix-turn-helix transcriptional regulator [Piscinibacter sp.]|uniref:helix-turn-helix transcriptional regulator n=1 Tax=Piscinibacter sp. TaxID=1903157 RepID=UPI0039E5BA69